jgi:hypothetical protein
VVFYPFVLFHFLGIPFIHCFGSAANIFIREELLARVSIPKQFFLTQIAVEDGPHCRKDIELNAPFCVLGDSIGFD